MSDRKAAVHRPGPLKQQNKSHKHGKHKSKGSINAMNKGRVGVKALSTRKDKILTKADRRNQLQQLRKMKRAEAASAKRSLGTEGTPPHLVVCIILSSNVSHEKLHALLCSTSGDCSSAFSSTTTLVLPVTKQRFTLVFPPLEELYVLLDVAKVADTLLFVYHAADPPDSFTQLVVECCCSQGLPSTFHAIQGLSEVAAKRQREARKTIQDWISARFPKEKAQSLESPQDAVSALRAIGGHKLRPVFCRDSHPHLVAERAEFVPGERLDVGTLKVSGYIRSRALSVNKLVHITGVGDFQLLQTDCLTDPYPIKPHLRKKTMSVDRMMTDETEWEKMEESDVTVLERADLTKQTTLDSEVIPDPMEGEQTWPTEEELREADASVHMKNGKRKLKKVPKGTSEYQAAWIISSDGDEEDYEEEEDLGVELQAESLEESEDEPTSTIGTDMDTESVADISHYDANIDPEQERRHLELIRAEKEDRMFPDEVDTPLHIPARTRFAKYRGLKSFRHSAWDKKENLPLNYARIYQFQNFTRTKRRLLSQEDDDGGALLGWFVTVHIASVPRSYAENINLQTRPLLVFGLLPHEHKMSVLNFVLKRTAQFSQPIKSKKPLIFHCGPRRFAASPIFSQHTMGDKHKYERFFQQGSAAVATVFAPVSLPPTPVLVFQQQEDGLHVLIATGSLHSINPDRIVCKKIVLSGHPFKIHRRSAVIRYMFFNREDINWFKPVELRTKYGSRGHIKEPLGTHGHMKCIFDKQLKAQDTVLMQLYKRIFPKWTYQPHVPLPLGWGRGDSSSHQSDSCIHMQC